MSTLFCAVILLFSSLVAILAIDFHGNRNNVNFDTDWFWMGSDSIAIGQPKFKISEHPDGYSMQFSYGDIYSRIRYTDTDSSIDFNIIGYKGSLKYKLGDIRPGFEAEAEVIGDGDIDFPIDATVKVKYGKGRNGRQFTGPYEFEVSVINNFKEGKRNYMSLPATQMRDAKEMEAVFKISINPRNWAESIANFNMNLKGDLYQYVSGNDFRDNWFPGTYNLSAALFVINVEEPTPKQRQPKMTAVVDLEEDIIYDEPSQNVTDVPRNERLLKRSILLNGMINLTGKGSRLGVIKATDADAGYSIGRLQVRRADEFKENLRLEVFSDGEQIGALNLYENCQGLNPFDNCRTIGGERMINITVEGIPICEKEIDTEFDTYFDTDYGADFSNQTYINNTFSNTTNFQYDQSSSEKCTKDINRLFESVVVDAIPESFESKERFERIETRFYREPFLIGLSPSYKRSECEGNKCMVMEEKRFAKNGKYEQSLMFSGGRQINTLHSKLNNEENNTSIQLGVMSQYRHWRTGNLISDTDEKIDLEIKPKNEEDGYNLKLSYNNDRVFDGWFYFTSLIRRYAREQLPAMLERQMGSFGDTLMHLRNQDYQTALSWLL